MVVSRSTQRLAVVPRPEALAGYDDRPPRPKGVKGRRPDDHFANEAEALTVAAGHQRLVRQPSWHRQLFSPPTTTTPGPLFLLIEQARGPRHEAECEAKAGLCGRSAAGARLPLNLHAQRRKTGQ